MLLEDLFKNISNKLNENLTGGVLYDKIYQEIADSIMDETGIHITYEWLAGFMNQYKQFKFLDDQAKNYKLTNNMSMYRDTRMRILARNILAKYKVLNSDNKYLPFKLDTMSKMRKFYTVDINTAREKEDGSKATRLAADNEMQTWYDGLSNLYKTYVDNMRELSSEEFSEFKNILNLKENKKNFLDKLYNFINENHNANKIFTNMGFISGASIHIDQIELFRQFVSSLTNARLKDIFSKEMIYSSKKITHDTHRAKNAVLKDMEHNPSGVYSQMMAVYNFVSKKIMSSENKTNDFKKIMNNIPRVKNSDGKLNEIGNGVVKLFKEFNGSLITKSSKQSAIDILNYHYNNIATPERRAAKADTRGETLSKISDL